MPDTASSMPGTASAERAVIRVCRSGLKIEAGLDQVLAALRGAISIDAAFFATADPETLLFTGALSEEPLAAMAPRFLDNELGGQDVNTFSGLVRSPGHVRSLDTATRAERMASARYRDIMRPVELGDELRAAAGHRRPLGGLLLLHGEEAGFPRARHSSSGASPRTSTRAPPGHPDAQARDGASRTDPVSCSSTARWSSWPARPRPTPCSR